MSAYIIEIPDTDINKGATMYYPDERHDPMPVEPVVRCRDCKHMHTVRHWLGMDVDECWLHADPESGALGKERTEPDGFCAWGERRAEQ